MVKLHRFYPIAPTQEGMTFSHPSFDTESDKNEREIHLEWERDPEEGMATIHALAGYFKTWLYKVTASMSQTTSVN